MSTEKEDLFHASGGYFLHWSISYVIADTMLLTITAKNFGMQFGTGRIQVRLNLTEQICSRVQLLPPR